MKDKKILIVDDSRSMQSILRDMLEKDGYTNIFVASSGSEAVDIAKRETPALILLDIIMAGTNGMEVLRTLGQTLPIIVVSAIGQDPIIAEAKKLGAVDYLVKPVSAGELARQVQKHLK